MKLLERSHSKLLENHKIVELDRRIKLRQLIQKEPLKKICKERFLQKHVYLILPFLGVPPLQLCDNEPLDGEMI